MVVGAERPHHGPHGHVVVGQGVIADVPGLTVHDQHRAEHPGIPDALAEQLFGGGGLGVDDPHGAVGEEAEAQLVLILLEHHAPADLQAVGVVAEGEVVAGEGEDRLVLPGQYGGVNGQPRLVAAAGKDAYGRMPVGADQVRPGGLDPASFRVEGDDKAALGAIVQPGPVAGMAEIDELRLSFGLGGGYGAQRALGGEEDGAVHGPLAVGVGAGGHHMPVAEQGHGVPEARVEGKDLLPAGHVALTAAVVAGGQQPPVGGEAQGEVAAAADLDHVLPQGHVALAEAVVAGGHHVPVLGQGHGMAQPRGHGHHVGPARHLALAVQIQARRRHGAVRLQAQAVETAGRHLHDVGPIGHGPPAVLPGAQVRHGAVPMEHQAVVQAQGGVLGVGDLPGRGF